MLWGCYTHSAPLAEDVAPLPLKAEHIGQWQYWQAGLVFSMYPDCGFSMYLLNWCSVIMGLQLHANGEVNCLPDWLSSSALSFHEELTSEVEAVDGTHTLGTPMSVVPAPPVAGLQASTKHTRALR